MSEGASESRNGTKDGGGTRTSAAETGANSDLGVHCRVGDERRDGNPGTGPAPPYPTQNPGSVGSSLPPARTGAIRWQFSSAGPIKMSCVVSHGVVYVGDTAGMLYAIREKDGHQLGTRAFKKAFSTSPPVIVGNTLLIANSSDVIAMRVTDIVGRRPPRLILAGKRTGAASSVT